MAQPVIAEQNKVRVTFSSEGWDDPDENPDALPNGCEGTTGTQYNLKEPGQIAGFVHRLNVNFPNSEKYGVPDSASLGGGLEYIRAMGLYPATDFDVQANDTCDDSSGSFEIEATVDITQLVPAI